MMRVLGKCAFRALSNVMLNWTSLPFQLFRSTSAGTEAAAGASGAATAEAAKAPRTAAAWTKCILSKGDFADFAAGSG